MKSTIQYSNNTNTGATMRTAKGGFLRIIWPGGGEYAGDATTQLLYFTAVGTYQLMADGR